MKFYFKRQLSANDCGPTCVHMITAHYGRKIPISALKSMFSIIRSGVSALDIVNCFEKLKFISRTVTITKSSIYNMPLPAILHWKQDHFVILYNIKEEKEGYNIYSIADPSFGLIKFRDSDFDKFWLNGDKGIAIVMQPTDDFNDIPIHQDLTQKPIVRMIKLFKPVAKSHPYEIFCAMILILISALSNLAIPITLQNIVDKGILKEDIQIVWKFMLFQICFFCSYTISDALSSIILTKINFKEGIKVLSEYLYKLVKLPIKFFDTRLNSDLIKLLEDQNRIQSFLTYQFIDLFFMLVNIVIFSSILCYYSFNSFLIFLTVSIISALWTISFLKRRKRLDYDRFYFSSLNNSNVYEMIEGMSEIKINNAQNVRISIWEKMQDKLNGISLKALYLNYYQLVGSSFVNKLRDIIITFFCAYLVINNNISLGVMMTISYILGQLSIPISRITNFSQIYQDVVASLERLNEIQQLENEDNDEKILSPEIIKKGLVLSNISFKYIDILKTYVIQNLSLVIPQGKITAIVGASGSGKTTLLKLLLSFYYPQEGDIYLDGLKMSKINASSWREKCGTVMQDGIIFSGTVAENIALNDKSPNMERVVFAAQMACVDNFIEMLPMKYLTKLGKIGIDISGGQRQRILIARAIYRDPQIIFMDEATSSLDANNEKNILNNLNSFFKGRTVIIVAHRLSTVKNADNIVVMDKGVIVEEGTHKQLTSMKGAYYELVKNQLELGN